jgi:TetR/AcrR family transcriptional regulator, cholesterol catabolism regulator
MRERIVEEATQQFLQFGIRNVTMDKIASDLGISKRTVYGVFKDKTELVRTCIEYLFQQHETQIKIILETSSNVIEVFSNALREGMKVMNSINPVFFRDLKKFYPQIWMSIHARNMEKSYILTKDLLKQGIEEGLFREDINIKIVSKLFHEQNNLIMDEKVFPRNEFSLPEIYRNLTINFMRGISTGRGIERIDRMISNETQVDTIIQKGIQE